jgi:REP element-mobilizing transposase RayT
MGNQQGYKTIRLGGIEYSEPFCYFVTLCTHERNKLFGEIADGEVKLSALGEIVREEWLRSPSIRPELVLDEFVIMPDHMHGLVGIAAGEDKSGLPSGTTKSPSSRGSRDVAPRSLSTFIAQFKAITTKRINDYRQISGLRVSQPRFYDHVISSTEDLYPIRFYIMNNPIRWQENRSERLPWFSVR